MSTLNSRIRQENADDKISLKDLLLKIKGWFLYLFSQWKIVLFVGLLGGALGFLYASLQKTEYKAKLTFVLEEADNRRMGNLGGLASMAGITFGADGGGIFQGNNILELYKSRTMLTQTLLSKSSDNDSLLVERYLAFSDIKEDWEEKPHLQQLRFTIPQEKFTLQHDSIMGKIVKIIREDHLTVSKPDKQLSLISVETTIEDEKFARDFTVALVENVNNFYIETKIGKSAENLAILQSQTDSVRRELNAAIGGVAAAVQANPNPNLARQTLSVPSSRRRVDVDANEAILMELVRNLESSRIALRRETPLIQVVDKPILPLEKERIGKATGIVIGGFIAGILICFSLILYKEVRDILASE